jgi:hypothetical protein
MTHAKPATLPEAGRPGRWVVVAALGLAALRPVPARAEIVKFTNGRTLQVEACLFEGDAVRLIMPGGGEIRAPRSLVAELLPDEVPLAHAVSIQALAASPTAARPPLSEYDVRNLVDRVANRVGIDRRLAHAVVRTESNYQPLAISPKGAMGLMQIMPATARSYGLTDDPFDPERNLEVGMRHLKGLLSRFDRSRALAAYNAGEAAVRRYGAVPPYRETQEYVRRISELVR